MKRILSALALSAMVASAAAPAFAQGMMGGMPVYNAWQAGWDQGQYDHRHIILGRVVSFTPYRLTVQRRNGMQQTVDLRNGTIIRPTGSTPQPGQRVAMIGHYSNGTFVVGRLVLRP